MDFRELQYILTIAETRNITRASEVLRISQPSLSQFLRKVEADLGCDLFQRVHRGLLPTPAGEEYIRTARSILIEREDLQKRLNDLAHMRRGKLTVGITSQRGGHILPEVISVFKRRYPDIELKIRERLSTDDLERLALEGGCDLFLSNLPLSHEEISYRVLVEDRFYLVLPPSFKLPCPLADFTFERVTALLRSLQNAEFILPPARMKLGRLAAKLFEFLEYKPRVMFETHNIDTAQYMVLSGVGVTFTMESVLLDDRLSERPIYLPIDSPRFRKFLVAGFSNRDYVSNAAHCFVDEMKNILTAWRQRAPLSSGSGCR